MAAIASDVAKTKANFSCTQVQWFDRSKKAPAGAIPLSWESRGKRFRLRVRQRLGVATRRDGKIGENIRFLCHQYKPPEAYIPENTVIPPTVKVPGWPCDAVTTTGPDDNRATPRFKYGETSGSSEMGLSWAVHWTSSQQKQVGYAWVAAKKTGQLLEAVKVQFIAGQTWSPVTFISPQSLCAFASAAFPFCSPELAPGPVWRGSTHATPSRYLIGRAPLVLG